LLWPRAAEPQYHLCVFVPGGPTGAWSWSFLPAGSTGPLLAQEGYAVLLPNPRGSAGRGQEFARANLGDMGGGDLQDILAGVDALVEEGLVDTDRVGIFGGSYDGRDISSRVAARLGVGMAAFATELALEGETLKDRIRRDGALPVSEAVAARHSTARSCKAGVRTGRTRQGLSEPDRIARRRRNDARSDRHADARLHGDHREPRLHQRPPHGFWSGNDAQRGGFDICRAHDVRLDEGIRNQ